MTKSASTAVGYPYGNQCIVANFLLKRRATMQARRLPIEKWGAFLYKRLGGSSNEKFLYGAKIRRKHKG